MAAGNNSGAFERPAAVLRAHAGDGGALYVYRAAMEK